MLLKLTTEYVAEHWDEIRPAIEQSLPPVTSAHMEKVLESILIGKLQCWTSYERTENGPVVEGVLTTTVIEDFVSGNLNLLIYSFYSYRKFKARAWIEGYEALVKYGKSIGCEWVLAYSNIDYLANMMRKFGGDADFRLLRYPLKEDRHGK